MDCYIYAFLLDVTAEEVFVDIPRFPDIVSAIPREDFDKMAPDEIQSFATDAVLTALQACIAGRIEVPDGDNPDLIRADGFVFVPVVPCMKLELFRIYRENFRSLSDFARQTGKMDTAVRRLFDLRHPSRATEIEATLAQLGKQLVHAWAIQAAPRMKGSGSPIPLPAVA